MFLTRMDIEIVFFGSKPYGMTPQISVFDARGPILITPEVPFAQTSHSGRAHLPPTPSPRRPLTVAAPARPLFPSASGHPGPSQSPGLDQAKATFPAYGQSEKKVQLIATTGSSSKIIHPPEDISLEEMRASMPRYKPQETAPAPPQSAAAAALQYSMAGAAAAQASAAGLAAGQGHMPVMMPQQLDAASQLQLLQQQRYQ